LAGILGPNCEQVNENSTSLGSVGRNTILDMLCERGQKLKDDFAQASIRFSDSAPIKPTKSSIAERLEVEKLQLAQQDALSAFRQHVESSYGECKKRRSSRTAGFQTRDLFVAEELDEDG